MQDAVGFMFGSLISFLYRSFSLFLRTDMVALLEWLFLIAISPEPTSQAVGHLYRRAG